MKNIRRLDRNGNHLRFELAKDGEILEAIGFGLAERHEVSNGDTIDITYTIGSNFWNGIPTLQPKIRDIRVCYFPLSLVRVFSSSS